MKNSKDEGEWEPQRPYSAAREAHFTGQPHLCEDDRNPLEAKHSFVVTQAVFLTDPLSYDAQDQPLCYGKQH